MANESFELIVFERKKNIFENFSIIILNNCLIGTYGKTKLK